MTRLELIDWCEKNYACGEALKWLRSCGFETARECWFQCQRGDWLMWLAGKRGVPTRKLVAAAAACARHVLRDDAHADTVRAVELAERYGSGEDVPDEELRDAAVRAAEAAAWSARAAAWAARAAAEEALAAWAARAAAWAATAPREIADVVRSVIAWEEVEG